MRGVLVALGLLVAGAGAVVAVTARRPPDASPAVAPIAPPRDAQLDELVARARQGTSVKAIDARALELVRGGVDARISLARALARLAAHDLAGVRHFLGEARQIGPGTPAAAEAREHEERLGLPPAPPPPPAEPHAH